MAPGGSPGELDDEATGLVARIVPPVVIVPARVRSVHAALIRSGIFIVVTILAILFALPAALGAAGPAVVGG